MGTKKAKRAGKKKAAKKVAPRAAKKKAKPAAEVKSEPDLRGDFLRLVSKLGPAEAQRLLDTFVEVETPRRS